MPKDYAKRFSSIKPLDSGSNRFSSIKKIDDDSRLFKALKHGFEESTPGLIKRVIEQTHGTGEPKEEFDPEGFLENAAAIIGEYGPDIPMFIGSGGLAGTLIKKLGKEGAKLALKELVKRKGLKEATKIILKEGGKKELAKQVAPLALEGAVAFGLPGVVRETAKSKLETGEYDPERIALGALRESAIGAVGGPVFELGGAAAGRVLRERVGKPLADFFERKATKFGEGGKGELARIKIPDVPEPLPERTFRRGDIKELDVAVTTKGERPPFQGTSRTREELPVGEADLPLSRDIPLSEAERLAGKKISYPLTAETPKQKAAHRKVFKEISPVLKEDYKSIKQMKAGAKQEIEKRGVEFRSGEGFYIGGKKYKRGMPLTEEQEGAVEYIRMKNSAKYYEISEKMSKTLPFAKARQNVEKEFSKAFDDQVILESEFLGGIRGQAARQMRLMQEFRPKEDKAVFHIMKRLTKGLSDDDKKILLKELIAVKPQVKKALEAGIPSNQALAPMAEIMSKYTQATATEKFIEASVMFKLLSPLTQSRNLLGNTTFTASRLVEKVVAGGMDWIWSGVTRKPRTHMVGEAGWQIAGMLHGARHALAEAIPALLDDKIARAGLKGQEVMFNKSAIEGSFGSLLRALTVRPLAAGDIFFRKMNQRGALYGGIYKKLHNMGIKQGSKEFREAFKKELMNPSDELLKAASDEATKRVFQQEMGALGRAVEGVRREIPLLRLLFPFVKTPTNIIKEGLKRSPLGLFPAYGAMKRGAREEAIDLLAGVTVGSAAATLVGLSATSGLLDITGEVPTDKGEKDLFYAQKKQPFSIKVGDTWYTYRGVEPFSSVLVNAAALKKAFDQKDEETWSKTAGGMVREITRFSSNQTFMAGLSNLIKLIDDPDNEYTVKNFIGFLGRGAVIPSGVQQLAKMQHPELRRRSTILEEIAAGAPVTRGALPKKKDIFGEDIVLPTGMNALFRPTKESKDPTIKELARLNDKVNVKITPEPANYLGIKLTPTEINEHQIIAARIIKKRIDQLMDDKLSVSVGEKNQRKVLKKYSQMDDYEKKEAIKKIQSKVRNQYRDKFKMKARVIIRAVLESDLVEKRNLLEDLKSSRFITEQERQFLLNANNLREIKQKLDSDAAVLLKKLQ